MKIRKDALLDSPIAASRSITMTDDG